MTEKQLKELIREEYHNVKNFMEEKYGFTSELGKVVSNPYVNAFTSVNEAQKKLPKFKNIPSWAKYVAQHSDGEWFFSEETPTRIRV